MNRGCASSGCKRSVPLRTLLVPALLSALLFLVAQPGLARGAKLSDQNRDGVVDLQDLILFSQKELERDWQTVDWCQWLDAPHKHEKHLQELFDFIGEYAQCDQDDRLALRGVNHYPTRLAWGPDAQRLYVSDARIGSIFIYDSALNLIGEIKGLGKPLGVAVDFLGNVYVGDNQFDRVEVYSPDGLKTGTIGSGMIQMPNDLAFDQDGKLYVADSQKNRIWVFDPTTGENTSSIGVGQLSFPSALAISGQELFVADQSNYQVKVFDLQGNLLRTLGGEVAQGMLGYKWKGKFVRLQSLAFDTTGRLHALDSHMGVIQILDPASGGFIASYGTKGTAPGELNLPLDIAPNDYGEMVVTDAGNERVDLLTPP